MRYAVISDIHSNLEALTAVLAEIDTLGVDRIVCLGDLVGYNSNPNECIELVRERDVACVLGNHDSRAAGLRNTLDFNALAEDVIYWTRNVLTDSNARFLEGLPEKISIDNTFVAFHGWVNDPDTYIFGAVDALLNFRLLKKKESVNLSFFGHTHISIGYIENSGDISFCTDQEIRINGNSAYLINPGGLGQPRDHDPRAPFIIYDTEKSVVTFHRVEYDYERTAQKILDSGLPPRLAERLCRGL